MFNFVPEFNKNIYLGIIHYYHLNICDLSSFKNNTRSVISSFFLCWGNFAFPNYVSAQVNKKWGHGDCWETGESFLKDYSAYNSNTSCSISSGFWDIWGYVLKKWGLWLLMKLSTRCATFFSVFFLVLSFNKTLTQQNKIFNDIQRRERSYHLECLINLNPLASNNLNRLIYVSPLAPQISDLKG